VLAANTAFNGFPVLGSILAQDHYLPRQLHTRGDRLAYSNGILFLAVFAGVLIVAFNGDATRLIQLYIVGVFVSFNCSQAGMIRHWNRLLRGETDRSVRRRMRRSQMINTFGLCMTALVLVIVVITKFLTGAWIAIAAMVVFYVLMSAIRRHYDGVAAELAASTEDDSVLPAHNHAIVLVSKLHLPTLRAIAYARATRPDTLEALTVNVDEADTKALMQRWAAEDFRVPLKVIESPYREITRPVLEYVRRMRKDNPRDVLTVFIPEYVLGHWWEQILHNQSALRLKARLLLLPGVIVASVPYQLKSSARSREKQRGQLSHEKLQALELLGHVTGAKATPISQCGDREIATVAGTLRAVTAKPRGISPSVQADLWDGSGNLTLVWLGRRTIPGIEPGRKLVAKGRIATVRGTPTMYNPDYELRPSGGEASPEPLAVNR